MASARTAWVAAFSLAAACGTERSHAASFRAEAFDLEAAGALMVYDPTHPEAPGWRPLCGVALVHPRVTLTAGHCVQFLRAGMASGALESAWVSFLADPTARFDEDPSVRDPASAGWHRIASVHVSPATADFVALRRSDAVNALAAGGDFHDSGAVVLDRAVTDVVPLPLATDSDDLDRLLRRRSCGGDGEACLLVKVAYGPQEVPPSTVPPAPVRHAARLRLRSVDSLFLRTFDEVPGSPYGRTCPGDSGSPVVLADPDGAHVVMVALVSSPEEPFGIPCTGGALQYRVDTPVHRRFLADIVRSVDRR